MVAYQPKHYGFILSFFSKFLQQEYIKVFNLNNETKRTIFLND